MLLVDPMKRATIQHIRSANNIWASIELRFVFILNVYSSLSNNDANKLKKYIPYQNRRAVYFIKFSLPLEFPKIMSFP
jgi:hypothetical protein